MERREREENKWFWGCWYEHVEVLNSSCSMCFHFSLSLLRKWQQSPGHALHTHWQASTNTDSTSFSAYTAFGLHQTHNEKGASFTSFPGQIYLRKTDQIHMDILYENLQVWSSQPKWRSFLNTLSFQEEWTDHLCAIGKLNSSKKGCKTKCFFRPFVDQILTWCNSTIVRRQMTLSTCQSSSSNTLTAMVWYMRPHS